ncbi:aquaporin-12-like [Gastrophryne carolinensis]
MAGLNIVVGFFILVVALSQLIRWATKKILPSRIYKCTSSELAGSLQLCACYMELRMLVEIGLWGGGYGPDVVSTILFLLFLAHGFTFDGASANPTVSLQEFLLQEGCFIDTLVKLLAQYAGMEVARFLTKQYWMLELTQFHTIQMLMANDCSPSLQTSLAQGIFVEALCAFCYHLVLLRFQNTKLVYKVPTVAFTVTLLAYAGASYTASYFNPILAYALTFECPGKTIQENSIVYIGGSVVGMLLAVFLYKGNIPALFQRNLLYNQKSKFRIPKAPTVSSTQKGSKKNQPQQSKKTQGISLQKSKIVK